MFAWFVIPLSWTELVKRTARETFADDRLGLSARLAYYCFWMERKTMHTEKESRSLSELFAELTQETRTLIQDEMRLAKLELSEKVSQVTKHGATIAAGGFLVYAGVLTLVAAIALGLIALGLPPWAGTLICGLLIAGAGYTMMRAGRSALRRTDLAPHQTIQSLKETAQWLRAHAR